MPAPAHRVRVPALESGDRLDRAEFRRRYEAQPRRRKAELIGGIVYMGPARVRVDHASNHASLIGWLHAYSLASPGLLLADNGPPLDVVAADYLGFQPGMF